MFPAPTTDYPTRNIHSVANLEMDQGHDNGYNGSDEDTYKYKQCDGQLEGTGSVFGKGYPTDVSVVFVNMSNCDQGVPIDDSQNML